MMKVLRFNFILVVCMMLFNKVSAQAPVVMSLSPNDNATSVSTQVNLRIAFDRAIVKESGTIFIRQTSDNSVVESFDVNSSRITISNDSAVTVDPTYNFSLATTYYVEISSGTFRSSTGEMFMGISDAATWNFTTGCAQAPDNLELGFASSTTALLVWDAVDGVSEYQIWISGMGLYEVTDGLSELYIQGLSPGTEYSWSIKSVCRGSGGTFYSSSRWGLFTTTGTNPCASAPSLLAPNITNNSIKLNWSLKTGVSDYQVWVSGLGTFYTNGATSFTATNLSPGTTYSWSVKSVCSGNGNTIFSASASGQSTTTGSNPCTTAPSLLTPTVSNNSITINWTPKVGITDYQVWISGKGTFSTNGSSSFTIDNLPSGTTFSWSVRSLCSSNGNTIFSAGSNGQSTTTGENPCNTPPNVLETTDITESSVTLNWIAIEGVSDYQIWVSGIGVINSTSGMSSYPLFGLQEGSTYTWSVKSKCSDSGKTFYSSTSSGQFTTAGEDPCAVPPIDFEVTDITSTSATFTWSNTGATDYQLWISGEPIIHSTFGMNSYTINGLEPGTAYFGRVKSKCSLSGKTTFSALSTRVEFTTLENLQLFSQTSINFELIEESINTNSANEHELSFSKVSLDVFPNPSVDEVNVRLTGGDFISSIVIRNSQGRIVNHLEEISEVSKVLNLQQYGAGMYILQIGTNTNREFIKRIMIK